MNKTTVKFEPLFKEFIVESVLCGKLSKQQVLDNLGIHRDTLNRWIREYQSLPFKKDKQVSNAIECTGKSSVISYLIEKLRAAHPNCTEQQDLLAALQTVIRS